MTAVTKSLPNLIGGISQQPAPLRLNNQCEDQNNFISSPVTGLQSRPPLKFVSSTAYTGGGAFFTLDRDSSTKHNLWISPSGIRVETLNGTVKPVTYQADALNYLSLPAGANPRDSYKILVVADTTFILNRTKTTASDPNSVVPQTYQAMVHIKQVNYGTTWSVVLENVTASFGYSSDTNQSLSTHNVAEGLKAAFLADDTIATNFDIVCASSVLHIKRKDGASFTVGLSDTRSNTYSSLTTYKISDFTDLPTVASDGYIVKIIGSKSSTTDDYYVKFKMSNAARTDIWANIPGLRFIGLDNTQFRIDNTHTTNLKVGDTIRIAGQFGITATIKSITAHSHTNDGENGDGTTRIWLNVILNSPLKNASSNSTFERLVGYQVIDGLGSGTWEECVSPNVVTTLNPSTLPHILVHDIPTDSWTLKPATWGNRTVGDDESAPMPSFIGKNLNNIFLFRNRLGLLAGDSVCMSAAGDLERFFPETVQTMTDADPIDISVAVDDYSNLLATATVQDKLFFFSERRQYVLTSPDTLSPKTAAILPSTAYPCMPDVGLPVTGARLYFADADSKNIQLHEYAIDDYTNTKDATSITSHVPNLLPLGTTVTLVASQTSNVLALHTNATPNTLWLYQYYISGSSKLQAAWSRQTFPGTIENIAFRDSVLWIELMLGSQRILATLDLSVDQATGPTRYTPCLDLMVEVNSPASPVAIPYDVPTGTPTGMVLTLSGGNMRPTQNYTITGRSVAFTGTGTKLYFGLPYKREYVYSQVWPSKKDLDGSSTVLTDGRFQLRRWVVNHSMSGPYNITVRNTVTDTTEVYSSLQVAGRKTSILGSVPLSTDTFKIPCRGRNDEIEVKISSDNILPQIFISTEIEGNYIKKHTNV